MAPINKCALSLILSPPVSPSDSGESVHSSECPVASTSPTSAAAFPATSNKAALSFILSSLPVSLIEHDSFTRTSPISTCLNRKCVRSTAYKSTTRRSTWSYFTRGSPPAQQSTTATSGLDCINTVGGIATKKSTRFCEVNGCMKLSKHNKRCWRHGGSIKCQVTDCDNRAKSKGVCWSHGGGTLCSFEGCDTISVSKGFCWAHGGGKRCLLPDCTKPAYERTKNYCKVHYKAVVTHCAEWIVVG